MRRREDGFTLVEVLVAGAVATIIGLAVATLMSNMSASNASIKAHADFITLQNLLTLLASNAGCATAFQTSTGTPLAINLSALPATYASIQTCTGASTCGIAVPQIALPNTGVILTGPATDGALGANYTGSTPISPSNLKIIDLRFSDVIGTPPSGPGPWVAQVHLHVGATVAVGPTTTTQGVGNNFLTANIPITLTVDATTHNVLGCGTASGFVDVVTDVTGSRSLSTVYQNLTGHNLLVSGSANTPGGSSTGNISAAIGPTSPPTTVVWANQATATVNNGDAGFSFLVPNNYYYRVVGVGDVGGVNHWVEIQY